MWIPYEGEVHKITAMGGDKVVSFSREAGGYRVALAEQEYESTPIARVFCLGTVAK